MMPVYAYFAGVSLELIFLVGFIVFWFYLIYSDLKGSPFVPTKQKEVEEILKQADLRKAQRFYELGCGDGRVLITAVSRFGVRGVGVDVNPILIWFAGLRSRLKKLKHITFKTQNIFETDLTGAEVIYFFLMPDLLARLLPKLQKELGPGTLIISHGFKIETMQNKLYKTISHKPFPTYFYRW